MSTAAPSTPRWGGRRLLRTTPPRTDPCGAPAITITPAMQQGCGAPPRTDTGTQKHPESTFSHPADAMVTAKISHHPLYEYG